MRLDHTSYLSFGERIIADDDSVLGCVFFSGGHSAGETPDPIPNSEAKPCSADGTAPLRCGRVGRRREVLTERPTSVGRFSLQFAARIAVALAVLGRNRVALK